MISSQKMGGIAALVAAATYIIGFAVMLTVLSPLMTGPEATDALKRVAFVVENRSVIYLWNLAIYIVNGIFLVVLVLAIHALLRAGSDAWAQAATAFGLIWGGLVLAAGMLANTSLAAVAKLHATDPTAAAVMSDTLKIVQEGLGGGNEIVGGMWALLLSIAALKAGVLSRPLNWLGLVIGIAGLLTVIPPFSEPGGAIFGLGFILWFAWAGVLLLTRPEPQPR